jgi:hypothetical protein
MSGVGQSRRRFRAPNAGTPVAPGIGTIPTGGRLWPVWGRRWTEPTSGEAPATLRPRGQRPPGRLDRRLFGHKGPPTRIAPRSGPADGNVVPRVGRGRQGSGVVATGRAWSSRVGRGHHGSGRPPAAHPPTSRPSERPQPTPRAPPGWPRGAARRSVGRAARSPCAGPSSLPTTGRDRARSGRPACPDGCRGCSR